MAAPYCSGRGWGGGGWTYFYLRPSWDIVPGDAKLAGSGLPADVMMGRMRSALRAYALKTPDPAEVLYRLDHKMHHFEPGALATVLYAVIDPALDWVHIASAGHVPPVVALPGHAGVVADIAGGLMIVVDPEARRQVTTMKIPLGTVLCFYTDGLIERREYPIDEGLARLCQAVTAEPPDAACASVMGALVGAEPANDDIALLMFRRVETFSILKPAPQAVV